jgi:hypothetical protein
LEEWGKSNNHKVKYVPASRKEHPRLFSVRSNSQAQLDYVNPESDRIYDRGGAD